MKKNDEKKISKIFQDYIISHQINKYKTKVSTDFSYAFIVIILVIASLLPITVLIPFGIYSNQNYKDMLLHSFMKTSNPMSSNISIFIEIYYIFLFFQAIFFLSKRKLNLDFDNILVFQN